MKAGIHPEYKAVTATCSCWQIGVIRPPHLPSVLVITHLCIKLSELQSHIKEFDYAPEQSEHYFLKLIEEVGELSATMPGGICARSTRVSRHPSSARRLISTRVPSTTSPRMCPIRGTS